MKTEMKDIRDYIRSSLLDKFEFQNYGHALEILNEAFPKEWCEIQDSLDRLSISIDDLKAAGGNETAIPKKFDDVLYPLGWREIRITGDLLVKIYPRRANQRGRFDDKPIDEKILKGYIDGHNIDFIKDKVAFDLEWNSKDQTFDRDLLAMRTYFDCGLIEVGIIVTRSKELNDLFKVLVDEKGKPLISKYGASTTWMGKLEYRLKSRRNGGCPILAVGIKKACVKED
ncbi:BglII/BstYI family type II restriction endonuclease [uncultured Alistipes sp.]|uniref:BglII/BstYI family type II restriction endonuclease n=1 Tax=uncultured Alistipes sp. TaxID=538949 RepID=UPI0025DDEAD8|nr:BglII/BstYI family type II restriction endonuclease [uncultured Alistipes sp.]